MKKILANLLLGGALCLFNETQTLKIECPTDAGLPYGSHCGMYRWSPELFMSDVDLHLDDCGFVAISPWELRKGNYIKLMRYNGEKYAVGYTNNLVLVRTFSD